MNAVDKRKGRRAYGPITRTQEAFENLSRIDIPFKKMSVGSNTIKTRTLLNSLCTGSHLANYQIAGRP
jgi:hypothetical protein